VTHRIIKTEQDRDELLALLGTLKLPFTAQWKAGKDRSLDQNALQWKWATEAAQQLGDRTAAEVQQDWKLRHGVPILREGSEAFREKYDKVIRPLPFEEKLAFMDMIDVTSAMSVKQMTAFLDTVMRECLQNGLRLTDPT
jgi:hypothetical protein